MALIVTFGPRAPDGRSFCRNVDLSPYLRKVRMVKRGIFLHGFAQAEVLFDDNAIKGARSSKRFSPPEEPGAASTADSFLLRVGYGDLRSFSAPPGLVVIPALAEIFCSCSRFSRLKVVLASQPLLRRLHSLRCSEAVGLVMTASTCPF